MEELFATVLSGGLVFVGTMFGHTEERGKPAFVFPPLSSVSVYM